MGEVHELAAGFVEAPPASDGLLGAAAIFAPLPPVKWACQSLDIAPGPPTLVAGYGFSGKTLAAQDFALSVAVGELAWGSFAVHGGRVLHLDYEQGAYLTRLRYQRLARARGIDPRDLEGRLTLAPLPDWYLDSDVGDRLTRLCDGVDLVVIDSFRAACPVTDENSSEARVPLDRLTRVSEKTGAVPMVLHHARKPTRDAAGGTRMTIRGSGALFDACGSVLVFDGPKGEPITVSHEKARITGRPHDDFRLWITDVEIAGDPTAGVRVSLLDAGAGPDAPAASDRFADLKGRVLALVRDEGPLQGGVNLVRARLGGRKDDIGAAVSELLRRGALIKGGTYREPTLSLGTEHDSQ